MKPDLLLKNVFPYSKGTEVSRVPGTTVEEH